MDRFKVAIKGKKLTRNRLKERFLPDHMIYSPKVVILKNENGELLEKLSYSSIITAPVVNRFRNWLPETQYAVYSAIGIENLLTMTARFPEDKVNTAIQNEISPDAPWALAGTPRLLCFFLSSVPE